MKTHEVCLESIRNFVDEYRTIICSSWSSDHSKSIKASLSGLYEVWEGRKLIMETTQLIDAVKQYNAIQ